MTNFEKLKSMSLDDFAEFLDEHGMYDNTPWTEWWDKTYCYNCPGLKLTSKEAQDKLGFVPFLNETYECAYCEVYDKCKFFPNEESCPDNKDIIKLWLNAEGEENV